MNKGSCYNVLLALGVVLASVSCSKSTVKLDDHSARNGLIHSSHAVVSANQHASEIGRDILRRGGNAIDAAVATKIALTLVEPHETGLGGGGFLLYYDANTGEQYVYDGREIAPQSAEEDWFKFLGFELHHYIAVSRGRAVGVPGMLAMLHRAHQEHGQLPWAELFDATIALANEGIEMPPRMQRQLDNDFSLRLFKDVRALDQSRPGQDTRILRSPELAHTLTQFAKHGPDPMYRGDIGKQYRDRAARRWPMRGSLEASDFEAYKAVVREPLCGEYRGWQICSVGAPSSGAVALLQILGMLEQYDIGSMSPNNPQFLHLYAEASRLAFADRQYYIGDPAFVDIDEKALINPAYVRARARLINPVQAMVKANPGDPYGNIEIEDAPAVEEDEELGTSHLSVVDSAGNAVALTGSIEAPFGTRMSAAGLLLNNQLTDFDFDPKLSDRESPNRIEPGKRPRSSMAPTFIFSPEGELTYIIGSRGGSRIIGYVAKTIVGVVDWRLSLQRAIDLPNVLHRGERLEIEANTLLEERVEALRGLGHRVDLEKLESGLHGIERVDTGWRGAADKRMEGAVFGD